MATVSEYNALFAALWDLDVEKFRCTKQAKEIKVKFAEDHGINKKTVAKGYRAYCEAVMNKAEFVQIDLEITPMIEAIINPVEAT